MRKSWMAMLVALLGCSADINPGGSFVVPRSTVAEREAAAGATATESTQRRSGTPVAEAAAVPVHHRP